MATEVLVNHSREFRVRSIPALLLAATAVLYAPEAANGQTQHVLRVRDCSGGCAMELEAVASLGTSTLPFELSVRSRVVALSDGRLLVGPTFNPGQIAVFDADGHFQREIGRAGEGPGEYTRVVDLRVGPGDTIYVVEPSQISVLNSQLEFVRRLVPQRFPVDRASPSGAGELVILATAMGSREAPERLHVLDASGAVTRSFATAPRPYVRDVDDNERPGALAASPMTGGIWYAKQNEYAVELFVDAARSLRLEREVRWFAPWGGYVPREGIAVPPRPMVSELGEDEQGHLIVILRRPDPSFEEKRMEALRGPGEGLSLESFTYDDRFDTVVELLDPVEGVVIGRLESPLYLSGPLNGSLVYHRGVDELGRVTIQISRLKYP